MPWHSGMRWHQGKRWNDFEINWQTTKGQNRSSIRMKCTCEIYVFHRAFDVQWEYRAFSQKSLSSMWGMTQANRHRTKPYQLLQRAYEIAPKLVLWVVSQRSCRNDLPEWNQSIVCSENKGYEQIVWMIKMDENYRFSWADQVLCTPFFFVRFAFDWSTSIPHHLMRFTCFKIFVIRSRGERMISSAYVCYATLHVFLPNNFDLRDAIILIPIIRCGFVFCDFDLRPQSHNFCAKKNVHRNKDVADFVHDKVDATRTRHTLTVCSLVRRRVGNSNQIVWISRKRRYCLRTSTARQL